MRRFIRIGVVLLLGCLASCSSADPPTTTTFPSIPTGSTIPVAPPTTTSSTTSTSTTTTVPSATVVISPGDYADLNLEIHVRFRSEIDDVTSDEFIEEAMAILTDPTGWSRAGFTFIHDDSSELVVVLAEGDLVDELCLPLETFGTVSCQNGPVVAINADRWREAWEGWPAGVPAYRHYVMTHEVGHLIGLRHPAEACPQGEPLAAAMTPQTRTTLTCPPNGIPLDWEIEWASQRPAVVGPTPDWDGPKPTWPDEG